MEKVYSYTITDQELTQLEANLQTLKQNNNQLLTDLALSKTDLQTAKSKLTESQNQLEQLQTQLTALKAESQKAKSDLTQAQTQLAAANQSLDKYEKEVKAEINSLKMQRNLLGIAVIAVAVFARK